MMTSHFCESYVMGAVVSTRLEWSQTDGKANVAKESILQTSVINQDGLSEMVSMIEKLCLSYPAESKAEFKKPLQWTSSISHTAFSGSSQEGLWVFKDSKYTRLYLEIIKL